ncbi:MAG TPA: hypothetical protein VL242_46520 [Sorangium sp.]|nr:hypothetical protein [Sorangium sp.]
MLEGIDAPEAERWPRAEHGRVALAGAALAREFDAYYGSEAGADHRPAGP